MFYIKHNVIIRSKSSIVFQAVSTSEGIQGWWTVDSRLDPKLGGIAEFYAHCNFQWGKYLVSLKEYCETGKGFPFNPINEKN